MAKVKQEKLGDMITSLTPMEPPQYPTEPYDRVRWEDGFWGHHPLRLYYEEEQLKKGTGGPKGSFALFEDV